MSESIEKCLNPFKLNCKNADITVYIEANGAGQIPICRSCWDFLAENAEWDEKGIKLIEEPTLNIAKINDSEKINQTLWNEQIDMVKPNNTVAMESPIAH